MSAAIMFIALFVLMLIGVPVGLCLIIPCFILLLFTPLSTPEFFANVMYSGVYNFGNIALPFFVIAGTIMDVGGLSKRLVRMANSLLCQFTGSLGMVTVLACMLFGAVSGSAIATVAAIGSIMIPQMVRNGYSKYYATALVTAAGGLGIIVPPSFPGVLYAITIGVSVGDIFVAGFAPALLIGGVLMIINYFYCKKHGHKSIQKFNLKEVGAAFWDGKWAILMPVIILGGIYAGIFSATEAAVVACVYGIVVGLFIHRELSFKQMWNMFIDNIGFTGGMLMCMAPASAMSFVFAYLHVDELITNFFLGISTNYYVILLLVYAILFVMGMFVQTTPAIVIFAPVLLPIVEAVGMTPLHFGVIMIIALALAFISPPVAANLFMASSMTGISMEKIVPSMMPFLVGLILCMIIVGFVPEISLWLPTLLAG